MDSDTSGALGIIAFLVSMAGVIYAAVNHKRVRCKCCGKDIDMSVDVDSTVKVSPALPKIRVPPPPPEESG